MDKSFVVKLLKGNNNKLYKLLIILMVGVCLMIIVWPEGGTDAGDKAGAENGGLSLTGSEEEQTEQTASVSYSGDNTAQYTEYMESRLRGVLESMSGISDVSVMITVRDSGEKVTLRDVSVSESHGSDGSGDSSTSEKTVTDEEPYVTQYVEPSVEGVVVCCKGADSADTVLQITNAVQALFDVPVHKIVVLEAN